MAENSSVLLMKRVEEMIKSATCFSFFGFLSSSPQDKYETAVELYIKAAAEFRLHQKNSEAGKALEKAAEVQNLRLQEPMDAAVSMLEASKVYRSENWGRPKDAVRCLKFAVDTFCRSGNFRRAAKLMEDMAELYETKLQDVRKTVECYEEAAEWYSDHKATRLAGPLSQKVADLSALDGDYRKAIGIYETLAGTFLENEVLRYSASGVFLKTGICHLATNNKVYM